MKLRCRNTGKLVNVDVLEAPWARDTGVKRAPVTSGQPGDYRVHFPDGAWACKRELISQWGELIEDDAPAS
jgi:hypothetical protein